MLGGRGLQPLTLNHMHIYICISMAVPILAEALKPQAFFVRFFPIHRPRGAAWRKGVLSTIPLAGWALHFFPVSRRLRCSCTSRQVHGFVRIAKTFLPECASQATAVGT